MCVFNAQMLMQTNKQKVSEGHQTLKHLRIT